MVSKSCTKCNETKSLEEFSFSKNGKYGKKSICKSCAAIANREYERTIDGLIAKIYKNQLTAAKKNTFKAPTYSKEELYQWVTNQANFLHLYNTWVVSGYSVGMKPSVDRINDYIGYTLSNIQLLTVNENIEKYRNDVRNGINTKVTKTVSCYSLLDGTYISTHFSITEAAKAYGISSSSISSACAGRIAHAGSMLWQFGDSKEKIEKLPTCNDCNRVIQVDYVTGNIVHTFLNPSEASTQLGISLSDIIASCKIKREQAGGFVWRYVSDIIEGLNTTFNIRNKKVYQIDKNTNEILNTFDNKKEASRSIGKQAAASNITAACNGRIKTAFGYKWRNAENYIGEIKWQI